MRRKRFIVEQDDIDEMSDFKKIFDVYKKKIHYSDVEFVDSNGESYDNVIEVQQDGLLFSFDGLVDYLRFFFKDEYGEEGSDSYYDAQYYDEMYNHRFEWYSEFNDRYYDDWNEGFIIESFNNEQMEKLKEIVKFVSPSLISQFHTAENGRIQFGNNSKDVDNLLDLLSTLKLEDNLTEAYIDGQVAAVQGEVPKYIEETYCNCLKPVGIERYSSKYCFWKYFMAWGDAVTLFARFGTPEGNLLDLIFEGIKKTKIRHLPTWYELSHEVWSREDFNRVFYQEVDKILDNTLEDILSDEKYSKDYLEVLGKVTQIGGLGQWIKSKNKNVQIRMNSVDPETLKIDFMIAKGGSNWSYKKGRTTIDEIINLLNVESLFDPESFREHYLRFLRNSVL